MKELLWKPLQLQEQNYVLLSHAKSIITTFDMTYEKIMKDLFERITSVFVYMIIYNLWMNDYTSSYNQCFV